MLCKRGTQPEIFTLFCIRVPGLHLVLAFLNHQSIQYVGKNPMMFNIIPLYVLRTLLPCILPILFDLYIVLFDCQPGLRNRTKGFTMRGFTLRGPGRGGTWVSTKYSCSDGKEHGGPGAFRTNK